MDKLNELKDGQKVLVEAVVARHDSIYYPFKLILDGGSTYMTITQDLKNLPDIEEKLIIYDFEQVANQGIQLERGKEYEFSNDGVNWYKGKFTYYGTERGYRFYFVRPIQQPTGKELEAIELLKSLGYKIEK